MAVLILSRYKVFMVDYKNWLKDYTDKIIIFTHLKYEQDYKNAGYETVIGFEDFNDDNAIFAYTQKIFNKFQINRIIALDERDIIRAAYLREQYSIIGQCVESALAYRNKIKMREYLLDNNIPVIPFKSINHKDDVYRFIDMYKYPVVLKPVAGMGALNTFIINNDEELNEVFDNIDLDDFMIEKFMDCPMGTFDGIIIKNKLVFSSSCIYFKPRIKYNEVLSLSILSERDDLYHKLKVYGESVIKALPDVFTSVFHCEIFIDKQGLFLCECASRSPGGKIDECIRESYGINMNEVCSKAIVDIDTAINGTFKKYTGSVLIPKKSGILLEIPDQIPFDWVTEVECRVKRGEMMKKTKLNGDVLMTVVVEGKTVFEIKERCNMVEKFIINSVKINENNLV